MTNKNFFLSILIVLALSIPTKISADIVGTSDTVIKIAAEPILTNLLKGFKNDDYKQYSADFDASLKESISAKRFKDTDKQLEKSFGEYVSREYLGFLNKHRMTVVLWKGKFEKSKEDVLIKLIISKRGEEHFVTGLWFQ